MTLRSIVPRAGVPQRPDVTSLECDQNCGKPKVMQQYRKQLSGFARPGGGKLTISQLERPGGSVVIDISDSVTSCGHCGSHCLEYVEECIEWAPNVEELITAIDWPPVKDFKTGTYYTDASANEYGVCISCDPQSRVIRSMTKPRLQFHDSTATYLQSRCMTYDQRLSIQKIPGIVYIDPVTKLPLPPSEYSEGAQSYQASPCVRTCGNGQIIPVVYKPNNTGFARQGAVSGGARTASLGHNVQTVNGGSYGTAYGLSAANYGDYQGEETGSYYIKTQPQRCMRFDFTALNRRYLGATPAPIPPPPPPPPAGAVLAVELYVPGSPLAAAYVGFPTDVDTYTTPRSLIEVWQNRGQNGSLYVRQGGSVIHEVIGVGPMNNDPLNNTAATPFVMPTQTYLQSNEVWVRTVSIGGFMLAAVSTTVHYDLVPTSPVVWGPVTTIGPTPFAPATWPGLPNPPLRNYAIQSVTPTPQVITVYLPVLPAAFTAADFNAAWPSPLDIPLTQTPIVDSVGGIVTPATGTGLVLRFAVNLVTLGLTTAVGFAAGVYNTATFELQLIEILDKGQDYEAGQYAGANLPLPTIPSSFVPDVAQLSRLVINAEITSVAPPP